MIVLNYFIYLYSDIKSLDQRIGAIAEIPSDQGVVSGPLRSHIFELVILKDNVTSVCDENNLNHNVKQDLANLLLRDAFGFWITLVCDDCEARGHTFQGEEQAQELEV